MSLRLLNLLEASPTRQICIRRGKHSLSLTEGSFDRDYANSGVEKFYEGDGSKKNPFRFPNVALNISPYVVIVELWDYARRQIGRKVYVQANDFLFLVSRHGVTSENGEFTKLEIN